MIFNKKSLIIGVICLSFIYTLLFYPLLVGHYPTRDAFAKIDLSVELAYYLEKLHTIPSFNLFTYQPTTPYFSTILLSLIIFIFRKITISYFVIIIAWAILGYIGMFKYTYKIAKNKMLSFLISLLYVISIPYLNEAFRGHLGIILGYSLFPWIMLNVTDLFDINVRHYSNTIYKKKIRIISLAILFAISITAQSYIIVITTIQITAIIITLLIVCLTNYSPYLSCQKFFSFLKYISISTTIALLLTTWYWIPLITSRKLLLIQKGSLVSTSFYYKEKYSENFIYALSLLPIYLEDLVVKNLSVEIFIYIFSIITISLTMLSIIVRVRKVLRKHNEIDIILLLVLFILSTSLSLGVHTPLSNIINMIPIINSMREYYYFIGLVSFTYFSLLSVVLADLLTKFLYWIRKGIMTILRNKMQIRHIFLTFIILILVILQPTIVVLNLDDNSIYLNTNVTHEFSMVFDKVGCNNPYAPINNILTISIPGGWKSVYSILCYNKTKVAINGLYMGAGALNDKPVAIMNIKSPFILSQPIIGKPSLVYKFLYENKIYNYRVLPQLLSLLDTKYIILNYCNVYLNNLIYKLDKQLKLIPYIRLEYNGTYVRLYNVNLSSQNGVKVLNDIILYIGSISSLIEYISSINNYNISKIGIIYYSELFNTNLSFSNIYYILSKSSTVVFASGSSYLDLVYLLYLKSHYHNDFIIFRKGNIQIINLTDINKFLLNYPYKYIMSPTFLMKPEDTVIIKPISCFLKIFLDNKLIKTINIGKYPGFGYKWIIINNLTLSYNSTLALKLEGKGDTILDSIMLLPYEEFQFISDNVEKMLSTKKIVYMISPNSFPIIGGNIHVEKDEDATDSFILLVPWHTGRKDYIDIDDIFIPPKSLHDISLKIVTLNRTLKYIILTNSTLNLNNIFKIGEFILRFNNISNNLYKVKIISNPFIQEKIDYIILQINPNNCNESTKRITSAYSLQVQPSKEILSDAIAEITIKHKNKLNNTVILLPILYNNYIYVRSGNNKITVLPMLGLTAVFIDSHYDKIEICIKGQRLFELSYLISIISWFITFLLMIYCFIKYRLQNFEA